MKLIAAAAMPAALASGQWLNTPMPGLPRTPDGKVDLERARAEERRRPSGFDGRMDAEQPSASGPLRRRTQPRRADLPWSAALTKERANGARGKDDPARIASRECRS